MPAQAHSEAPSVDLGHFSPSSQSSASGGHSAMSESNAAYLRSPIYGHKKYQFVKELDRGTFGTVELAIDRTTGQAVAIKFIPRTSDVSKYVQREILNHRKLNHPHIIQLKEVFLTHGHLGIAMEYASGGNLYNLVSRSGGLSESDARWYFQQLIYATQYCHMMGVCNRDIKLENSLLASEIRPLIKLCDFGYSKDENCHSAAGSKVGTPAYLAPEVVQARPECPYDGKGADIWSLGVALFVMLCAQYPFGRPEDSRNHQHAAMRDMLQRISLGDYAYPRRVRLSREARDLIGRMLVVDPAQRISMADIVQHPWFCTDLPHGVDGMNQRLLDMQRIQPTTPTRESDSCPRTPLPQESGGCHPQPVPTREWDCC